MTRRFTYVVSMVGSIGKLSLVFFVHSCLTFVMFFNQNPSQLQLKVKAGGIVCSCKRILELKQRQFQTLWPRAQCSISDPQLAVRNSKSLGFVLLPASLSKFSYSVHQFCLTKSVLFQLGVQVSSNTDLSFYLPHQYYSKVVCLFLNCSKNLQIYLSWE